MRNYPTIRKVVGIDEMDGEQPGEFLPLESANGASVEFRKGVFTSTSISPVERVSLVLIVDVLEHVEEDCEFLSAVASSLLPGGRVVIHVPATNQWHPLRAAREALEAELLPGVGQHVREGYSEESLGALLGAAGLEMLECRRTFARYSAYLCDLEYTLSLWGRWTAPFRALLIPMVICAAYVERFSDSARGNGLIAVGTLRVRAENDV